MFIHTVLVVEDDADTASPIADILRMHEFEVLTAHDPVRAIQICATYPSSIEVLLTDVLIPKLSGPKLAEQLVAMRPQLKVVYMSAYRSLVGDIRHAPVLQKPFSVESLLNVIHSIV